MCCLRKTILAQQFLALTSHSAPYKPLLAACSPLQAFPICFPGTAVWRGRQARFYILSVLHKAVERSWAYLQASVGPRGTRELWYQALLDYAHQRTREACAVGKLAVLAQHAEGSSSPGLAVGPLPAEPRD